MDGNKDAAQKCVEIGNQALKEGDKLRAHRFLSKAQRLDPSLALEDLLSSLGKETSEQDGDTMHEKPTSPVDQEASSSGGAGMSYCNGNGAQRAAAAEFSSEQVDVVRRIRKTKDYYQILGLEKECSAEEIRKAYRKVSLKVHPDKNKAPGSDEAFKKVSKAFACLNEPELRQKYDQYGPEEAQDVAQHQGPFRRHRNGFVYEDMFDANEIFNAFFNGTPYAANGFQRGQFVRTHRAGGPRVHTREVHVGGMLNLLQLLPILALFLLSYFPFSSKPIYSLNHAAPYEIKYETKLNTVPFYVKSPDFDKDYPLGSQSRRSLEAQIEREYVEVLRYNCRQELGWKQWHPSTKTPHCDRLQKFKAY